MATAYSATPLLQLRIRMFRNEPETIFPLYCGENSLGRDPDKSTVWLPMPFISAHHCTIDVTSNGHAWVQDLPKREDQEPSYIEDLIMQPGHHYEFHKGRRLKLGGLVTCLVEGVSRECNYRKNITCDRVLQARKSNLYRTRTMGRIASRRDYPEFGQDVGSGLHNSSQCDSTQDHSSIPCTLSAVGQTLSLEDVIPEGDMMDAAIGHPLLIPQRMLPPELTALSSQRDAFQDEYGPTLPFEGVLSSPEPKQGPEHTTSNTGRWLSSTSSDVTAPINGHWDSDTSTTLLRHDMPTQVFDRNAATQVVVNSSMEIYDRNTPTQAVTNLSMEISDRSAPTQAVQRHTQLILDQDSPTQLISGSMSTQVIQQTQLAMEIQSISQRDLEALSQIVDATQPSVTENFKALSDTSNQYDADAPTLPIIASQSSQHIDPDAPTQLLDISRSTLIHESSLSSTSGLSLDQISTTADRIESTQVLVPQGSSIEPSENNPLSGTIEAPDSLPDVTSSTQPLPSENRDSVPSAPQSRRGSSDRSSQDSSLAYFLSGSERLQKQQQQQHIRIPSTPIDVINQQQTPARSRSVMDEDMDGGADSGEDGDTKDDHDLDVVEATQIPLTFSQTDLESGRTSRDLTEDIDMHSNHSSSSRAESPKHELSADSGKEDTSKPIKQIRRERTDLSVGSVSSGRAPSRILQRRLTMDMDMTKVAVLFSAPKLEENDKKRYADIVVRLGGVNKDEYKEGTILVHSASSRTYKFMCAIVRCIPIVSIEWIEKSDEAGRFLPCMMVTWLHGEDYVFYDGDMEKTYNFSLEKTCKMAKDNLANNIRLFEGYSFYFITQNGQHRKNKERSQEGLMSKSYVNTNIAPMVNVCGGKMVAKEPTTPSPEKSNRQVFIVGPDHNCPETQEFIQRGFTTVRKEFILNAILKQTVEIQQYIVLPDAESKDIAEDSPSYSEEAPIGGDRNEIKRRLSRTDSASSNIVTAEDGKSSLPVPISTAASRPTAKRQSRTVEVDVEPGESGSSSKGNPGATKGTFAKSGSTVQGKGRASKRY